MSLGITIVQVKDSSGNNVSSTTAGSTNPLDVAIRKSDGTYLDPTQIRALTSSDVVTANAGSGTFNVASANLELSQGSTTSGQKGPLVMGAVTTSAPSYTTGQTNPFSLTTSGSLRIDGSGSTQPVSGTVTANQGGAPWSQNITQVNGVTLLTGNGVTGTGSPRVTIASDNTAFTVNAAQSGTWTVEQGSAPWSFNHTQINGNTVLTGNGVTGTGSQRVTIASDNTAFSVNAVQSGNWSTRTQDGSGNNITSTSSALDVNLKSSSITLTTSSKTALTASSPTFATVGTSSAQAVASNSSRKGLTLINTSNNTISLGFGATAVLNSGITLTPFSQFTMDEFSFNTGAINAIAGAASSNLAIQEFTT